MEVINLKDKLGKFPGHYDPKIIAELNGQHVKLVKFKGDFVWHSHKDEDELFFVIKGSFFMDLRDKTVEIKEGEMIVIPKGVEHRPRADEEVHVLLFEPASTLNTGDVENEMTKKELEWI
ncbi:MAG: cupin domain-containing protein [Ignavibacteria bacterium]|nr:cupin domain-containing protein [Ignavibacteria bacterium]